MYNFNVTDNQIYFESLTASVLKAPKNIICVFPNKIALN